MKVQIKTQKVEKKLNKLRGCGSLLDMFIYSQDACSAQHAYSNSLCVKGEKNSTIADVLKLYMEFKTTGLLA